MTVFCLFSVFPANGDAIFDLEDAVGRRADGSEVRNDDVVSGFEEEFFEFGDDVFAVSVFPEGCEVRADLVHEDFTLRSLTDVEHLLYDVVGVLVFHHHVESAEEYRKKQLDELNIVGYFAGKHVRNRSFKGKNYNVRADCPRELCKPY